MTFKAQPSSKNALIVRCFQYVPGAAFLLCLLLFAPVSFAQTSSSPLVLTIEDSIALALRNNRTIKSAYIERVRQKFDLVVAEDLFTPHFSIDGGTSLQRTSRITTTSAWIMPKATMLFPTGATVDFSWRNQGNRQGGYSQDRSSIVELGITQQLGRGAGITVSRAPVTQARIGEKLNKLALKRTVSETIASVIRTHRELLRAQEEVKLAKASLERAESTLEINNSLISAGRMAKQEILQTEADLQNQRIRLFQSERQQETSRLDFLDLLALDLGTAVLALENTTPKKVTTPLTTLLPIAYRERPDYLSQLLVLEQAKLGVVVAKNQQLWDVSVSVGTTMGREKTFGLGGGTLNRSDFNAALAVSIPLNDLSRRQEYVSSQTTLRNTELSLEAIRQGVELQVRRTVSNIESEWMQLGAADQAHRLAQQAVDVERQKLLVGRSTNFQVRSLESDLRGAEIQKLNALISYLNALADLDLQLGTTLQTWQIHLRD